jgi:ferric enterobactin receptor
MKHLYYFFLFIILHYSSSLFAQNKIFTLSGKIRDAENNSVLVGANIYIQETKSGASTNKFGSFSFALPQGTYTLRISFLSFKTDTIVVNLNKDQSVEVSLKEDLNTLNEVVVSDEAENRNISKLEVGVTQLNIKTIKKIPPLLGEVDVVRSLLLLPGVTSVGEGATGFNVRGGSIDQNLVLQDEAPIYNTAHLMGLFSIFNPDMVKSMTLYRAGIPSQYGGRISSVLDIKIKEASTNKPSLHGGIGLVASRLQFESPIIKDKLTIATGVRGSFSDFLFKVIPDANVQQTKANFYDFTTKVAFKPTKKDQIYLTTYLSGDLFRLAGDSLSKLEVNASSSTFRWQTTNATLRWNHIYNEKLFSTITAVWSDYSSKISSPDEATGFSLNSKILYQSVKALFNYSTVAHKIDIGVQAIKYDIQPANLQPTNVLSNINPLKVPNENALEVAGFVGDEWEMSKNISLMYGVRYSWFANQGASKVFTYAPNQPKEIENIIDSVSYGAGQITKTYSGLEPRLILKVSLDPQSSIKLSYNRMRQYVHLVSNTTAALPTDRWKTSDNHVRPQVGDQIALGYFRNFKGNEYESYVEFYYKKISDIVDYKDGVNLLLSTHPETAILQGSGESYGAEVMIRKNLGKLNGWLSYTYSQTNFLVNGSTITEKINNGEPYPANFNKPHNLSLVVNYEFDKRVSLSANFTYSTGRPITYPSDKYFVDGIYIPNFTNRNQAKIPDYHRLDLSLNIEPKQKNRRFQGSWVIAIYNLYARRNAYSIFFRTKNDNIFQFYNRADAFRLSIFGSIIPSITYNFKF